MFVCVSPLKGWMLESSFIKLGVNDMPPEATSTIHDTNFSKCWGNNINITWIPEPIVMKLGMKTIPYCDVYTYC
jgi:hypothetical protein